MNKKIVEYIKLIRVKHYLKNMLIFLPLFFSGQILTTDKLINTIIGFISFSLVASMIYIFNDYKDIEKDKKHNVKKYRPLAAGTVSKKEGIILLIVLFAINVLIVLYLTTKINNYNFIYLELIYLVINILYSIGLKKVPILDLVILVSGFMIRLVFGGVINDIAISNWLYLTVLSVSFYMALGKRRNELIKQKDSSREVLKKYNKEFLDKFMNIFQTLTIVFYSLWCIDSGTNTNLKNYTILTIPMILIILMKYSLNIEKDTYGDPIEVIYEDKVLILLCIILGIAMGAILYIK